LLDLGAVAERLRHGRCRIGRERDVRDDAIVERIQRRGRDTEREVDTGYWTALHARYERWIAGFRHCPVLSIDVRDYDLVSDPQGIELLAARVRRGLEPELPQRELWA
jgi:deoxyadenosine/deoxycytidine kinase